MSAICPLLGGVAKLSLRPRANRDSVGLRSMMGRREGGQGQFFYAFDLDKVVPPDHLVRQIDSVIDLSWVHKELAPYYSDTGRPSIDPGLMIRMLIVGYVCLQSAQSDGFALRCRSIWPTVVLQARYRGQDSRSFGVLPCAA